MKLSDVLTPRDRTGMVALLVQALTGIGHVTFTGSGTGSLTLSGSPTAAMTFVVRITGSGEVTVATYQYSTDGGKTWSANAILPASVTVSGVTLAFAAGPVGAGTSFISGDVFQFQTWLPTFPAATWQSGSTPRTIMEMDAEGLSDLDETIASLAAGGYTTYAKGPWLRLLAQEFYNLPWKEGTNAVRTVTVNDTANEGPFSVSPGQITIASGDLRFTNVSTFTVPKNGSVATNWRAELKGAAYNLPAGSIPANGFAVGALPGATLTDTGTWVTQGVDDETDDQLRTRLFARWSELGAGGTDDFWSNKAKAASAQVTRVGVATDGFGNITVTLAGPSGAVDAGTVTTVNTALQQYSGVTSQVTAAAATNRAVTMTGTVTVRAQFLATAQAAVATALANFAGNLPIGGEKGAPIVSFERLWGLVATAAGVLDVTPTAPLADIALGASEVLVLTTTLTWVSV